jgi:hypothetical protein
MRLPITLTLLALAACQANPPGSSVAPPLPAARPVDHHGRAAVMAARSGWLDVPGASYQGHAMVKAGHAHSIAPLESTGQT